MVALKQNIRYLNDTNVEINLSPINTNRCILSEQNEN